MNVQEAPTYRYKSEEVSPTFARLQLDAFAMDCEGYSMEEITVILNKRDTVKPMKLQVVDIEAMVRCESIKYGMHSLPPKLNYDEFVDINESELNCIFAEAGSDREPDFNYEQQVEAIMDDMNMFPHLKYFLEGTF